MPTMSITVTFPDDPKKRAVVQAAILLLRTTVKAHGGSVITVMGEVPTVVVPLSENVAAVESAAVIEAAVLEENEDNASPPNEPDLDDVDDYTQPRRDEVL